MDPPASPVPLDSTHDLAPFSCGVPPLDAYLKNFALRNEQNRSARTYVAARAGRVVGYYTLAAGSARREETPARIGKGLAARPVPVILLARLAADHQERGRGLGAGLLKDALLRILQASEIVGCRAVMVQAKDETARSFYTRFAFTPSPTDPFRLFLLLKDLQETVDALVK